ncbi:hypothetical protein [Paenibacillus silvisoli]|uniref:hypothetical protein n=1 Tax=Paenibacillus silvisoli TaxID=3110539 RepID=UPI002806247E|nr:hypothetical protein [Paenibacillus silvisoli]
MKKLLTGAILALAIAIPVSAYAADGLGGKEPAQSDNAAVAAKLELAKKEKKAAAAGEKEAGVDPIQTVMKQLGLDKAALGQAMKDGKTFADIAKAKGLDVQPLIDQLAERLLAGLSDKLKTELLTAEEKANVRKKVSLEAERIYTTPLAEQLDKGNGNQLGLNMKAVLDLLSLEKAEYGKLMDEGKSLVAIAEERGFTRDQLLDAITADLDAQAKSLVEGKQLTQAEADRMKQQALLKIGSFIDGDLSAKKK